MTQVKIYVIISLVLLSTTFCGNSKGTYATNSDMNNLSEILGKLKQEAKLYYSMADLPSYSKAKSIIAKMNDQNSFSEVSGIDIFFVTQIAPNTLKFFDNGRLTLGYVEAIKYLPITWWGMPDNLTATSTAILLTAELDQKILISNIDNDTRLFGSESEDNTIASKLNWTCGDYIHLFLGKLNHMEVDIYKSEPLRKADRKKFVKKLSAK